MSQVSVSEQISPEADELLGLLGEVLSGLAVPYSISQEVVAKGGHNLFGSAAEPYGKILDFPGRPFGYTSAEEFTAWIKRVLA